MRGFLVFCVILIGAFFPVSDEGWASDFVIYSVYRRLSLGNGDEPKEKDYYINMGSKHGIHLGSVLQVFRKTPTYDLVSEQLYRDVTFPIALIKVIHVESLASVARLEKILSEDATPIISPRAVMVGDVVRVPE